MKDKGTVPGHRQVLHKRKGISPRPRVLLVRHTLLKAAIPSDTKRWLRQAGVASPNEIAFSPASILLSDTSEALNNVRRL